MGKAIILSDVSFAAANLGTVTLTEEIPVQAISITGPSTFTGITMDTLGIVYNPLNTSERGVTWSITNGSQYASINASTGVLTVLSGASSSAVTVKAVSTHDSSVEATKIIMVTYQGVGPTPVYSISRTYATAQSATEKIDRNTTPVNADFIVMITLSNDVLLDNDNNVRVFGYTQRTVPYHSIQSGKTNGIYSTGTTLAFAVWCFPITIDPSIPPEQYFSLEGKKKYAIKKQGNTASVTVDGTNWTALQLDPSVDLSLATAFAFGRGFTGSLTAVFFNDLSTDISPLFS